jgi:hypothetical protein
MPVSNENVVAARMMTTNELLTRVFPNFISPVPTKRALAEMLHRHRIPFWKSNVAAARGGGPVYWQVSAVERLLRQTVTTTMGGAL